MNENFKIEQIKDLDPVRERVRKNFDFSVCFHCKGGIRKCMDDCVYMREFERTVDLTKRLLKKEIKNLNGEEVFFLDKFYGRD